jgi:folate-dependent phosphoribosylglycinamide formyltransferase PurN
MVKSMEDKKKLPFDRYAFKDMPFEVAGYDRLIRRLEARPDFPAGATDIYEIADYLQQNPIKVFVLGSYYRGFNLINALSPERMLDDDLKLANTLQDVLMLQAFHQNAAMRTLVKIVGVATDRVITDEEKREAESRGEKKTGFISQGKRIWNYPEAQAKKDLVPDLVRSLNEQGADIAFYDDRVKTEDFNEFVRALDPDIAFMGTFGQKIDQERIDLFPAGIFNFHPIGNLQWPHVLDSGPQPFEAMIERGEHECRLAMHATNTELDDGAIMGVSHAMPIPDGATPPMMHERSSPYVRQPLAAYFDHVLYRLYCRVEFAHEADKALAGHRPGIYGEHKL